MGSSNQVTQNGNTTLGWTLSGGSVSNRDVLAPQLDNNGGGSGVAMSNVVNRGSAYDLTIRVVGSGAVAFRLNNTPVG